MSTWGVAECGTVAASCGMELMSGSGVLLGGEMASGVITMRGFSCDTNDNDGKDDNSGHIGFVRVCLSV